MESSLFLPLTSDAGYLLSAAPPDLGHGVAPFGCSHVQGAVVARAQEGLEELPHVEGQEGQQ